MIKFKPTGRLEINWKSTISGYPLIMIEQDRKLGEVDWNPLKPTVVSDGDRVIDTLSRHPSDDGFVKMFTWNKQKRGSGGLVLEYDGPRIEVVSSGSNRTYDINTIFDLSGDDRLVPVAIIYHDHNGSWYDRCHATVRKMRELKEGLKSHYTMYLIEVKNGAGKTPLVVPSNSDRELFVLSHGAKEPRKAVSSVIL